MKNLYKVKYITNNILYKHFVIAENEKQLIENYPKDLSWKFVESDIQIL